MNFGKSLLLAATFFTLHTDASVFFTKVTARGSGCPQGSTDIVKTPDASAVSVLFSDMVAELPQFDGDNENDMEGPENRFAGSRHDSSLVHKVCNIEIEADVSEGQFIESVSLDADFRGATYKDYGTKALFSSYLVEVLGETEFSHRTKNLIGRKVWREGTVEEDWTISESKEVPVKSKCKAQARHKVKFKLQNIVKGMISVPYRNTDTSLFMSLDSADLAGMLKLKVNLAQCRGNSGSSNGNGYGHYNPRPRKPVVRDRRDLGLGKRPVRCPRFTAFNHRTGRCEYKRERPYRR
ncbi:MAG: DUF4360 domain-containing protein [Oligoflexia bacterium]|nr:DUF4360 domain-containing protein [Oligoflexia bacterium]